MIDRNARDKLAESLRHFIGGHLSNYEFELEAPESDDPAVAAVFSSIWILYDDFKEQKLSADNAITKELRSIITRWMLFLYSDYEYEWPIVQHPGMRPLKYSFISRLLGAEKKERDFMESGNYSVWPFFRVEDYEMAKTSPTLLAKK